jgi:hypothetical protein
LKRIPLQQTTLTNELNNQHRQRTHRYSQLRQALPLSRVLVSPTLQIQLSLPIVSVD